MIYACTLMNGIIFDSLTDFPLGVLLITLIGLLNEKFSVVLYRHISSLFFPEMDYIDASQGVHSDRRKRRLKRPETAIKRRIKALIFTVFRRNPSFQITSRFFR